MTTPVPTEDPASNSYPAQHFKLSLEAAVRGGGDTDTVAAIAGALLGARWGVSAVPVAWQRLLKGWPGLRYPDLVTLALDVERGGPNPTALDYGYLSEHDKPTTHPHDDGVILGPVNAAAKLPANIDAVVSLCRVDDVYRPPGAVDSENRIEIWLIDSDDPAANENLLFVLDQAASAVVQLRAEGRTVFLHCAAGQSRTPFVGALVGARAKGIPITQALVDLLQALPDPEINQLFRTTLENLPEQTL